MKGGLLSQLFLEEEAVQRATHCMSLVLIRIAPEWTKKGAVASTFQCAIVTAKGIYGLNISTGGFCGKPLQFLSDCARLFGHVEQLKGH